MAEGISIRRSVGPVQLDDADRQLIELLRQDGRASNRALAAAVGLTEVTIASRIKRLVTNDAISITAALDWEAAGYEWFVTGHFVCNGRSPREVAVALGTIESCNAASVVFGEVDIIATFLIAGRAEMQRLVSDELPRVVGAEVVALDLSLDQLKYRWSAVTFPANLEPRLRFPNPVIELDEMDHRLIAALVRDSRQSNREIGRQLDVSEGTIRMRLRRLTDSGLLRLTAVVDPVVLGTVGSVAFCFVNVERTKVKAVLKALGDLPQCWQMAQSVGRFDIEMLVVCEDRAELVDLLMGTVRSMKGVQRTTTMEVIEVPHHAYHWARFVS